MTDPYELTTWQGDYLIEKFTALDDALKEGQNLIDSGHFVTLAVYQGPYRVAWIPDERKDGGTK